MVYMTYSSELDEAQLKYEMRQMYKEKGFTECLRILAEMLISARVMSEVMVEERLKENQ